MALFLLSAVFALSVAATPAVNLSNIVLPVQPTAAEQAAARELEIHLKRLTGKNIVVGREGEKLSASAIYLGNTEFARAAGIRCTGFDRDAWLIRRHQDSLIIAGGLPVGTLYGVYEFLEKFCKILWLDQYYTYYPEKGSVELPGKIDETGKPVFAYRGIFTTFNDAPGRIEFLVRNRENLFFEEIGKPWQIFINGGCCLCSAVRARRTHSINIYGIGRRVDLKNVILSIKTGSGSGRLEPPDPDRSVSAVRKPGKNLPRN